MKKNIMTCLTNLVINNSDENALIKAGFKKMDSGWKYETETFDNNAESKIRADIAARARQLKDLLGSNAIKNRLTGEVDRNIEKERISKIEIRLHKIIS